MRWLILRNRRLTTVTTSATMGARMNMVSVNLGLW